MGAAEDGISELPECLIHHILSFLPIKCIASTTILSKRWNNLWLSIPILDFTKWRSPPHPIAATHGNHNEEEVDSDSDEDSEQDDYRVIKDSPPVDLSETNRFMDFLYKVLFLGNHSAHIKKFNLKTDRMHFDQDRVKKWINSIVMRDVEELILFIKCSGPRVCSEGYTKSRYDSLYEFVQKVSHVKQMEVVKLFLESARVLRTVTLGSSSHHLEHLNKRKPTAEQIEDANDIILEQLQTFSWASADCSVKFLSP